jgi:nitrite reductase (NO-forming)
VENSNGNAHLDFLVVCRRDTRGLRRHQYPAGNPQARANDAGSGGPSAGSSSGTAIGDAVGTIDVTAADLSFDPSNIVVDKAGTYEVRLTNKGAIVHNITFEDGSSASADPGKSASVKVAVPEAGLMFKCTIPGHAAAGMQGMIMVGGVANSTPAPGTTGVTAAAPSPDPDAPAYTLRDATAPLVMSGTVHDIDLPIVEKDMTVAAGYVVHVWTFGGTVPGPVIRAHLGDTVNVHLTNQGTMSHSIDFHASQTAINHQMVDIAPGATFTYTFTADYAGVWMYHCGTAPALEHIANGMFGMVIVEPKGGLPKVDKEVALVQSEWYLGAQSQPADYTKASSGNPAPDFVVFQRDRQPIQGQAGRRANEGSGACLRARCRPEHRQLVPRRRDDLRHGHQGRDRAPARQQRRLGLPGGRPLAGPGSDYRERTAAMAARFGLEEPHPSYVGFEARCWSCSRPHAWRQ